MSATAEGTWWPRPTLDRERWSTIAEPMLECFGGARERGRMPQSLLIVGPEGLGRECAAVEAAALLTCPEAGPTWCDCASCRRVREGIHPDVAAVMPSGAGCQIGIDQVRAVVEAAPGRPFEAAQRVWIFDGVEVGRFGAEAANAFLKTLEEPPGHVRFVLLAENPEAVLPTIRSRCQQLALPGSVAVAERLGLGHEVPELAAVALAGCDLDGALGRVRAALESARRGEVMELVRLAHHLRDEGHAFEVVTAGALQEAAARGQEEAEALVCLAQDLLVTGRAQRALNLSRKRQLLACLLAWYWEVAHS
jgi:DNA polymerase-3 subunit delta'